MDFGFLGTGSLFGQFAVSQLGGAGQVDGLLGGLFAQLFGNVSVGSGEGADLSQLFETGESLSEDVLAALDEYISGLSTNTEGGETSVVSGMMQELTLAAQALVQVRQAMENISQVDVLPADLDEDTTELTKAFVQMGMSTEEALEKAEKIEQAMDTINKVLGLPVLDTSAPLDEQQEQLAQVEESLKVVVQQVSVYVVQLQVRDVAFSAAQQTAPQDIMDLILNDKPITSSGTQSTDAPHFSKEQLAEFQQAMKDLFETSSADDMIVDQEIVEASQKGKSSEVVSQQQQVSTETAVAKKNVVAQSVTANVKATSDTAMVAEGGGITRRADVQDNRRYQSVERGNELKAPEGVEVYKWQTSKSGMDILSQVQDLQILDDILEQDQNIDSVEDVLSQMSKEAAQGKVSDSARTDSRVPFSERLMQAARAQVSQQVSVQVKTTAENGGGSVRIQLNPEELGTVDIELEVKNGRVHGVIAAERPEVIEQMARDLQFLKQSLESAGLSLGENGMSFMLKQDGDANNDTQYASSNDEPSASENAEIAGSAGHASQRWIAPDRLLDVSV